MSVAYDKIVDLGETIWLIQIKNRMREHGEGLSFPSGPPDHLKHLMINLDDGPCYEFICQKFMTRYPPIRIVGGWIRKVVARVPRKDSSPDPARDAFKGSKISRNVPGVAETF